MSLEQLLSRENYLETDMGKAFLSQRVVLRGYDLHKDLGQQDWFSLYLYSITGRFFSEKQKKILNYLWVCTSYPDPSIWPNAVVALAASARSTASLAINAGNTVCEASIYGGRPLKKVMDFLHRTQFLLESGQAIETIIEQEIQKKGLISGYGRPLTRQDERVIHTISQAKEWGVDDGKYYCLALQIDNYLQQTRQITINMAALAAALAADIGLSIQEFHLFMTLCFVAGMVPCFLDAQNKPEGTFFPMRCESVIYQGIKPRQW